MVSRAEMELWTPQLLRFSRALATGQPDPSQLASSLVEAALRRASEAQAFPALAALELRLRLYALLVEAHREHLAAGSVAAQAGARGEGFPHSGQGASGKPPPERDKLAQALLSLPLDAREALLLVVIEGLTYTQAASVLKIPQIALVARLAQARAVLTKLLTPQPRGKSGKALPAYLRVVK
ncbi:MAG TPA: sigma factor-like helix-turn-helix DNA-binding protein [Methylocella sp.]|nr:sigma factor-like helix-turn-helix DNA-binding protein [Methylocella sp.]